MKQAPGLLLHALPRLALPPRGGPLKITFDAIATLNKRPLLKWTVHSEWAPWSKPKTRLREKTL